MKNCARLFALFTFAALSFARSVAQTDFWQYTNGPGVNNDVRSLAVNSQGVVYAGTWTDSRVWRTTDNGVSWSACAAFSQPNPVLGLCVDAHDYVYASVFLRGMFRSTDGGNSWTISESGPADLTVRSSVVDVDGSIWVGTESGMYRSTNQGVSWYWTVGDYHALVYLDSTHAVVSQGYGVLYRTTDHGTTWTTTATPSHIRLAGIHPDGSYFGSDTKPTMYRSTDLGASWQTLETPVTWTGALPSVFAFGYDGDVFFAMAGSGAGILHSTDNGSSWRVDTSGLTNTWAEPILHTPNGYVFVGTTGGGVFRSTSSVDSIPPLAVNVHPRVLDFDDVRVGMPDTLRFVISNRGNRDTLRIDSANCSNSRFRLSLQKSDIPPQDTQSLAVVYSPDTTQRDSGTVRLYTNDPASPVVALPVSGRGYALSHAPVVLSINLMAGFTDRGRIEWARSTDDSAGAGDQAVQYSVWQLYRNPGMWKRTLPPASLNAVSSSWDFIGTIPAIGLEKYSAVVSLHLDYEGGNPWNVFMIAVQTRSGLVFLSAPDSVDPIITGPTTGVEPQAAPKQFFLRQNYPNPFNPSTTIEYGLGRRQHVRLLVYNELGQRVATLVDGAEEAGVHSVRFDGSRLASGVYFCRLSAGNQILTTKLILLR